MEEEHKGLMAYALKPRKNEEVDPIRKLFAQAVDIAIDQDYVELWDVCNALGLPHPYGYSDDEFDSEEFDDERATQECDAIWERLDEEFEKFFGMTRAESRII